MKYQTWVHGTMDMGIVEAKDKADAHAQTLAELRRAHMADDCGVDDGYGEGGLSACGAGRVGAIEDCIEAVEAEAVRS